MTFLVASQRALGAAVGFYGGGIVTARFPQFPALVDRGAATADAVARPVRRPRRVDPGRRRRAAARRRSRDAPVDTDVVRYADAEHGFHCDARAVVQRRGRGRRVAAARSTGSRGHLGADAEQRDRWPTPSASRAAIAAIDAGNARRSQRRDRRAARTGPKEIVHAELVTEWVLRLRPDASEPLLLAARGHHFRRWTVPRASAPAGPRRLPALAQVAAGATRARARRAARRPRATTPRPIARVQAIVRKDGLAARRTTKCRCSRTRCASCSSRRSSSTSPPASIRTRCTRRDRYAPRTR